MFTYEENSFGHITLISPTGETIYLQVDTDIESFLDSVDAIDSQYLCNGDRVYPHPAGFTDIEEEISDMISNYFG